MLSIHDYRNGRYQGQFKNNLPHGIRIFMHISLTFVIAQWSRGHLDGKAIMIFADGSTYCGFFSQSSPKGLSFYELSMDQIQILQISGSNQEYKGAILLPLQNKIIELGSRNYEIKKQHKIIDNNQPLQLQDVAQIIGLSQNQKRFYRNFPNCYSFFENYFCQTYPDIFEEIIITINGLKQYWIGFKEQGLGIRLQAVHQTLTMAEKKIKNSIELSKVQHRCLEGKVYMIREMGMMSKDNNLTEYGLKTTNQLLKGYTIQEGIFQLPHTITRYQSTTQRPKVCSQTFANHLKRSFHYRNTYLDVSFLQEISKNKGTIEEDIVGTKKQVLAHSLIQRPNKRKKKEDSQTQNLEAVSQDSKDKQVSSFKRGESFLSGNKNWSSQLQEVKKEIYNSIQLKKSNKKLPNVDYTNIRKLQNDQQPKVKKSPEKQMLSSTKELNKFNQRSSARNENYHPKNDSLTKDKSKSRDYIWLRKNGSITPRKKYDYIRQQKALKTQKLTKSPPRVQPRTSPGYILKTEKSKGNIKTSPIKQRVAYRDNTQILVPQLKKHLVSAAEKTTEGRFVAVTEKKKFDDYLLRENQGRSYLSHNKKKRLLNELDNFQL